MAFMKQYFERVLSDLESDEIYEKKAKHRSKAAQSQAAVPAAITVSTANEQAMRIVIDGETAIIGTIRSNKEMLVLGEVQGEINCGDLTVVGHIKGPVTCTNLTVNSKHMQSDVKCLHSVTLAQNALIKGNVHCADIIVYGILDGDIEAAGKVHITQNAHVHGNITAGTISIDKGAKLQGSIKIMKKQEVRHGKADK